MPPAMKVSVPGLSTKGKALSGGRTMTASPCRASSTMLTEPPLPCASRFTVITYRWRSAGSLHSEYFLHSPLGTWIFIWEPAENSGNSVSSSRASSNERMPCATWRAATILSGRIAACSVWGSVMTASWRGGTGPPRPSFISCRTRTCWDGTVPGRERGGTRAPGRGGAW
ncbi:hypothetical protein D3C72_1457620 [compost metagenome]